LPEKNVFRLEALDKRGDESKITENEELSQMPALTKWSFGMVQMIAREISFASYERKEQNA